MKRFTASLLLLLVPALTAFAQGTPQALELRLPGQAPSALPSIRHVSDRINSTPEAQAALASFQAARRAGLLPAKTATVYEIGEARDFVVLTDINSGEERTIKVNFTLRSTSAAARIWVETELLSNLDDDRLAQLEKALLDETPATSHDPSKGIIELDNQIFGAPPNVDGDGLVDILMHDIVDGGGFCCTVGFVRYQDLDLNASPNVSNHADILYLDIVEGLNSVGFPLEAIAAHEYQHLIQGNYGAGNEILFVNEGLSQFAMVATGYHFHDINYLQNPDAHRVPFFDWENADDTFQHYQRSGLFFTYLAQRTSTEAVGRIVQAKDPSSIRGDYAIGAVGVDVVLKELGLTLEDVLSDFHLANFINDQAMEARYGHTFRLHRNLHAVPTSLFNDTSTGMTSRIDVTFEPGSVQYFTWNNVKDIHLQADITEGIAPNLIDGMRSRLRLRAILEPQTGGRSVVDFSPGPDGQFLEGNFARVTLALIHAFPQRGSVRLDILGEWATSGPKSEEVAYDNGSVVNGKFFTIGFDEASGQATTFTLPEPGAQLTKVSLAPFYLSHFSNGGQPVDAPRNVTLKIYSARPDGRPDQELFSLPVTDPRGPSITSLALNFFEVDLTPHAAQLANLPDRIVVVMAEAGTDQNYTVVGVSPYTVENVSFIGDVSQNAWLALWDVQFQGDDENNFPVKDHVIPIRATFLTGAGPVAVEEGRELPAQVTLAQNYPNPFNPATSIRFTLPQAARVRLVVHDLLGREVATLVDGVTPAGTHAVQVDAATWASGLYVYTLEAAGQRLAHKMLLVK